VAKELL
jgi:hypothetical protein